jgi:hypothetical protein
MNDNLQPEANEEVEGKPESVIGKLFKSKK